MIKEVTFEIYKVSHYDSIPFLKGKNKSYVLGRKTNTYENINNGRE